MKLINIILALEVTLMISCAPSVEFKEEAPTVAIYAIPSPSYTSYPDQTMDRTKITTSYPNGTPTSTPLATSTLVSPTSTVDITSLENSWVQYCDDTLPFCFEYPELYNFPAQHPMHDDWFSHCAPESSSIFGSVLFVGDWIEITINTYPNVVTPTPFSGSWEDWLIDSYIPIHRDENIGFAILGRKFQLRDIEGRNYYYDVGMAKLQEGRYSATIYFQSTMAGTPLCLYSYPISNEELFLHIVDTFDFILE